MKNYTKKQLEALTLVQLKKLCRENSIKGCSAKGTRKADVVELVFETVGSASKKSKPPTKKGKAKKRVAPTKKAKAKKSVELTKAEIQANVKEALRALHIEYGKGTVLAVRAMLKEADDPEDVRDEISEYLDGQAIDTESAYNDLIDEYRRYKSRAITDHISKYMIRVLEMQDNVYNKAYPEASESYSKQDLQKMTVKDLRELCKTESIVCPPKTRKSELVELIFVGVGGEAEEESEAEEVVEYVSPVKRKKKTPKRKKQRKPSSPKKKTPKRKKRVSPKQRKVPTIAQRKAAERKDIKQFIEDNADNLDTITIKTVRSYVSGIHGEFALTSPEVKAYVIKILTTVVKEQEADVSSEEEDVPPVKRISPKKKRRKATPKRKKQRKASSPKKKTPKRKRPTIRSKRRKLVSPEKKASPKKKSLSATDKKHLTEMLDDFELDSIRAMTGSEIARMLEESSGVRVLAKALNPVVDKYVATRADAKEEFGSAEEEAFEDDEAREKRFALPVVKSMRKKTPKRKSTPKGYRRKPKRPDAPLPPVPKKRGKASTPKRKKRRTPKLPSIPPPPPPTSEDEEEEPTRKKRLSSSDRKQLIQLLDQFTNSDSIREFDISDIVDMLEEYEIYVSEDAVAPVVDEYMESRDEFVESEDESEEEDEHMCTDLTDPLECDDDSFCNVDGRCTSKEMMENDMAYLQLENNRRIYGDSLLLSKLQREKGFGGEIVNPAKKKKRLDIVSEQLSKKKRELALTEDSYLKLAKRKSSIEELFEGCISDLRG